MLAILAGLAAAIGLTGHDYLALRVVRRAPVVTMLFWAQVAAFLVLVPVWLLFIGLPRGEAQWHAALIAALSGPMEMAGMAALLKGFTVGKFSIVGPLGALAGGFGAIYAIVLGESVSSVVAVGLPLAVLGTVLASIERPSEDSKKEERRTRARTAGAGWALLSAAIMGLEPVVLGSAAALPPVAIVAISKITAMLVLAPMALLWARTRLQRSDLLRSAVAGIADGAALTSLSTATAIGSVAVAAVLLGQVGTFSALLGVVVLRERLSRPQIAGVVTTVVAVTLLALGG